MDLLLLLAEVYGLRDAALPLRHPESLQSSLGTCRCFPLGLGLSERVEFLVAGSPTVCLTPTAAPQVEWLGLSWMPVYCRA